MSTEVHHSFVIDITFPNGSTRTVRELGVSKWHAIDKAYTKYSSEQPDRHRYSVRKPIIKVRLGR